MIQTISDTLVHAHTLLADLDLDRLNPNLIIIFGVGGVIAVIGILSGTIAVVSREKARQRTKREIAAYVAEGSMTPEDAARVIEAKEMPDPD